MDDLARLINELNACSHDGADSPIAVATVVNTKGSAYRRAGARMIIHQSMTVTGAISAGCLERDIIAQCETLIDNPRPLLLTYDGESADELIFGLKLGCDGIVQILVEPVLLIKNRLKRFLMSVPELLHKYKKIAAVTVFSVASLHDDVDSSGLQVSKLGTHMLFAGSEICILESSHPQLQEALQSEALRALQDNESRVIQCEIDGLILKAFVEVAHSITSLVVFGSGQDVLPVVKMAEFLGWQLALVDARRSLSIDLEARRFDGCIIMTHDYEVDKQILKTLFSDEKNVFGGLKYVGIVGPKRRAEKLIAELALLGIVLSEQQLSRIFSPVGLDIGAERPEEIALSILAEVQAVLNGHSGGLLRNKQGPIHKRQARQVSSGFDEELRHLPEMKTVVSICRISDA